MNVGNNPIGIDFNPTTNKAYITNEKDKTISVLDCNVPSIIKFLTNILILIIRLEVEGSPYTVKISSI